MVLKREDDNDEDDDEVPPKSGADSMNEPQTIPVPTTTTPLVDVVDSKEKEVGSEGREATD